MRMKLINRGQVITDFLENLGRRDSYKAKFDALCKAVDHAPEIACVPLAEYEKLERCVRELEKQLSDVGSSPFDGGMSQRQCFEGETDCKRRERWILSFSKRRGICDFEHYWRCSGCNAHIKTDDLRPPSEHRCHNCGACMDWGNNE